MKTDGYSLEIISKAEKEFLKLPDQRH